MLASSVWVRSSVNRAVVGEMTSAAAAKTALLLALVWAESLKPSCVRHRRVPARSIVLGNHECGLDSTCQRPRMLPDDVTFSSRRETIYEEASSRVVVQLGHLEG